MTDAELKAYARERIAEIISQSGSHQNEWTKTNAILALTKPDGTRLLGIVSDEQKHPTIIGGCEAYKIGQEIGYKSDDEAGFKRLVGDGK